VRQLVQPPRWLKVSATCCTAATVALVEAGRYDATWELMVYPVLREARHLAHRLLLEKGLGFIKLWLEASHHRGWMERWQYIELAFNPMQGSISAQESSAI